MKTYIYGLAGIIVACLIFAAVAVSRSELAQFFSTGVSPDFPTAPIADNSTIAVSLSISNFTEPLGPGSEANVTVDVMSRKEMSNVKLEITLSPIYVGQGEWPNMTWTPIGPRGIDLIERNSTWMMDLQPNVSASITVGIKATEIGIGAITATATWWDPPSAFHKSESPLYVQVLDDKIAVYNESQVIQLPPISPPSRLPYPPPNVTLLPAPGPILFDMSLSSSEVAIARGDSLNITVTIHGRGNANVSLTVEKDDPVGMTILPLGMTAVFDKNLLTVQANSTITVNLTIYIENEATPDTCELAVAGIQRGRRMVCWVWRVS